MAIPFNREAQIKWLEANILEADHAIQQFSAELAEDPRYAARLVDIFVESACKSKIYAYLREVAQSDDVKNVAGEEAFRQLTEEARYMIQTANASDRMIRQCEISALATFVSVGRTRGW